MKTIEEIRSLFPHITEERIYFNNAAIGILSDNVLAAINKYLGLRNKGELGSYADFVRLDKSTKRALGKILNAPADRLAWVENVSMGMNILANGLNWEKGDRVILCDIEFPANIYPFLNLRRFGVEIDFIKTTGGKFTPEDIGKLITPRTKLLSISAVQFLSGFRADLKSIGDLCKGNDIIFAVDAIQAAGTLAIDTEEWNIDYLAGGTQKWLMAMQGLSYIFIRKELQEKMSIANLGWLSVDNAWNLLDYDATPKEDASRFQTGTVNELGINALKASLEMFNSFGIEKIEKRILENHKYLSAKLIEIGLRPVLTDSPDSELAGIISFPHQAGEELVESLVKKKINVASREGLVRISPHFYNTREEIDKFIPALKEII